MKLVNSIIGGLAGALALNIIHETARHLSKDAPQIHKIGEEAVVKLAEAGGVHAPTGNELYATTLVGDVISNGLYYSAIGIGSPKSRWIKAISLGLSAGTAALKLTKPLGLDDAPVNKNEATKVMTMAWYLIGALVAAAVINRLERSNA